MSDRIFPDQKSRIHLVALLLCLEFLQHNPERGATWQLSRQLLVRLMKWIGSTLLPQKKHWQVKVYRETLLKM